MKSEVDYPVYNATIRFTPKNTDQYNNKYSSTKTASFLLSTSVNILQYIY